MSGWGLACCPRDSSPLIATFERQGKEFHCMRCGRWWEFLQPHGKPETPELLAEYEALRVRFEAGERGPIAVQEAGT